MARLKRFHLLCLAVLMIAVVLIFKMHVPVQLQTTKEFISNTLNQSNFHDVNQSFVNNITSSTNRTRVWCLSTQSPLQLDEVSSKSAFIKTGQYCTDGQKNYKLNINFNIERTFTFGWTERDGNDIRSLATDGPGIDLHADVKDIPKKLHFIWSDAKIPGNFVSNLKRFHELHPKWEFNFWTLKYGRSMIQKLEPKLLQTFNRFKYDVSRADMLRYVVMYHMGGAYFDIDTYPKMSLDNLTLLADCIVGPEPIEQAVFLLNRWSVLSNAGFLCKPKHAYFRLILDKLPEQGRISDILVSTGPGFFSNCFNSYIRTKIFNTQKRNISEPTNLLVVRHDYFEFRVHKTTFNVSNSCRKILPRVDDYVPHCLGPSPNLTKCKEAHHGLNQKDVMAFEACLEWTRHGREQRNLGNPVRYVDHLHFGAINLAKRLTASKESNMSEIVPGTILHM